MPHLDRDTVVAALEPAALCDHYGIALRWHGRWGRAKRCPRTDHSTDAFAVSRDGRWHCHACDEGGDLLHLVAAAESLDVKADFVEVLKTAAAIAGVEDPDEFGPPLKPPPPKRQPPPIESLDVRVAKAQKRAAWLWKMLRDPDDRVIVSYLRSRGVWLQRIPPTELRAGPINLTMAQAEAQGGGPGSDLVRLVKLWREYGVALAVRHVETGALVDVRLRRLDPGDGPKVVGMLGGVTSSEGELVGCYGRPHELRRARVFVVEGLADTLTAWWLFPDDDVIGAVDAGSFAAVAAHAARYCAQSNATLVLVAQEDGPNRAADRAVDKGFARALRFGVEPFVLECAPFKDLNAWHVRDSGAPLRALEERLAIHLSKKER